MQKDNKNRLFEVFSKVNKINLSELMDVTQTQVQPNMNNSELFEIEMSGTTITETFLPKDKKTELIKTLVNYCKNELNINSLPKIIISHNKSEATNNKSFGNYNPSNKSIRVVLANRNLADVCRSLVHELTHHKQNEDGSLNKDSGITGSEHENEANAIAGKIMRNFGKIYPEIFE